MSRHAQNALAARQAAPMPHARIRQWPLLPTPCPPPTSPPRPAPLLRAGTHSIRAHLHVPPPPPAPPSPTSSSATATCTSPRPSVRRSSPSRLSRRTSHRPACKRSNECCQVAPVAGMLPGQGGHHPGTRPPWGHKGWRPLWRPDGAMASSGGHHPGTRPFCGAIHKGPPPSTCTSGGPSPCAIKGAIKGSETRNPCRHGS